MSTNAITIGVPRVPLTVTGYGFTGATGLTFKLAKGKGMHVAAQRFTVTGGGTEIDLTSPWLSGLRPWFANGSPLSSYRTDFEVTAGGATSPVNAPDDHVTFTRPSAASAVRQRLHRSGSARLATTAAGADGMLLSGVDNGDKGDVMAQTKAERSAAAKKGAATRERNRKKAQAEAVAAGKKAAGTRQSRAAGESANQAKRAASGAVSGAASAVRLAGDAAKQGGKAVASKAAGVQRGRGKK